MTKVTFRCQTCNDPCSHEFEFKVFPDGDKFFVGQGPYDTEQQAQQIIQQSVDMIEKRGKKNVA